MALPEDHSLYQMTAEMCKARDRLEELDRAHALFKRTLRRTEFPTPEAAREAWTILCEQRRTLHELITQFEEVLAEFDTTCEHVWACQKRVWLDGLDAELAQLGRETHERPE